VKLLHTADWHLNDKLGPVDRTEHLRRRVEEVAAICGRENVDVLVIAGDLFSEKAKVEWHVNEVADSLRHFRRTFAAFFARGGIVLGVTGNHDQDGRVRPSLELARAGMDIAERPRGHGDHFAPGKMYLLDTAFVGRVRDRGGFDVQFVLLPFPNYGRVLTGAETAATAAELNRPAQESVAAWIRTLAERPGYDANLRTVFVAHLNVTGADVGRGMFHVGEETSLVLDAGALPVGFDYVALGHIHKPQCVRGLAHVRYSGSLDRMSHGERDEAKEVVLVDIGPDGRRADPVPVPITPTELVEVRITDSAELAEQIAAQVTDPANAIVKVHVEPAAADAGTAVEAAIREALPNVSRVDWASPEPVAGPAAVPVGGTVRDRVLNYLESCLHADDPQRAALLELAGTFLDQEARR
jgi:exonuclease SbcD